MGDDVVSVQVTADVGEYVAGMKAAASATTTSMDGIAASTQAAAGAARDSLGRFVAGAKDATDAAKELGGATEDLAVELPPLAEAAGKSGEAVAGFGDRIRQAGSRIRGEGRFAGFIARDLESIIPISAQAGGAIAGLVSGIAYGSGIAVAVAAVRLLVNAFKDGDSSVGAFSKDSADALAKMKAQVVDIVASLHGQTQGQEFQRKTVDPLEGQRDQQKQMVDDAHKRVELANELYLSQAAAGDASDSDLKAAEKGLAVETAKLKIMTDQLNAARELQGVVVKEENIAGGAKEDEQRIKHAQEVQAKLAALEAEGLTGSEKLQAEYVAKIEGYENDDSLSAQEIEQLKNAALLAYQRELHVEMEKGVEEYGKKEAELQSRLIEQKLRAEIESNKKVAEFLAEQDKLRADRAKRNEKYDADQAKSYIKDFIGPVTSASTTFFKGILLQQENVLDAIKSLAVSMAGAVIDGLAKMAEKAIISAVTETAASKVQAVSTTQGNIAMAATAAASSVAATPFVGPALAAAAFAETMGVLEAGSAPLLSARGGMGEVPFDDMPFLLHKKEMVMPEPLASGARNLFSAFSNGTQTPAAVHGGGGDVHHHHTWNVQAIDAKSFTQTIGKPEYQREIQQLFRTGRGVKG